VVAFVGGRLVAVGAGGLTARPVALAGFAGAAALTAFVVLAGVDRAAARAGRALPAATGLLAATALLALPVLGIVTAPRGERLRTLPRGRTTSAHALANLGTGSRLPLLDHLLQPSPEAVEL